MSCILMRSDLAVVQSIKMPCLINLGINIEVRGLAIFVNSVLQFSHFTFIRYCNIVSCLLGSFNSTE